MNCPRRWRRADQLSGASLRKVVLRPEVRRNFPAGTSQDYQYENVDNRFDNKVLENYPFTGPVVSRCLRANLHSGPAF